MSAYIQELMISFALPYKNNNSYFKNSSSWEAKEMFAFSLFQVFSYEVSRKSSFWLDFAMFFNVQITYEL